MDFTISTEEMSHGLARVQSVIEKKSTMPILANVLLEVEDNVVKLTATDLEISIVGKHQATVKKQGALAISAKSLYDIVRQLPGEEMTVTSEKNHRITLVSGKVEYKLVGMSADEYPSLPAIEDTKFVAVDPKAFVRLINRTLFAVSQDETRYNLNGVFFEPAGGDQVKLVATDGHRLALAEGALSGARTFGLKEGVIVPRKGLSELRKLLEESEEEGQIGFAGNHAVFKREGVTLMMRLLDGQFPDYGQVIPRDNQRKMKVNRQMFLESLRRVSIMSPDRSSSVKVEIGKEKTMVTSQNPDLGEAQEEIEAEYDSEDMAIGFNSNYLRDAVNAFESEIIILELADELSPALLSSEEEPDYHCVVMPMRV